MDVIICAAGQGKRMGLGKNKLFLELQGIPVLIHTLQIWEEVEAIRHIFVVVHPQERELVASWIGNFRLKKVKNLVLGGEERQDSVYNGLKAIESLEARPDLVLIHDGARPFVSKAEIERVIEAAKVHKATVLAVPVKDTIKKVNPAGEIIETLERSMLWAIQTPQAFDFQLILQAYEAGKREGIAATDDASLVERLGRSVTVVQGGYHNIKITSPEDIDFAEYLLRRRREE